MQGLSLVITVWDYDANNYFIPYDLVDEFEFDYVDYPGKAAVVVSGMGQRRYMPTE